MHLSPTHLPVPSPVSALPPCSVTTPPKMKTEKEIIKTRLKINTAFFVNVHHVVCCWSGPRPLASGTAMLDTHPNSSQIFCSCSSHGDPVALIL